MNTETMPKALIIAGKILKWIAIIAGVIVLFPVLIIAQLLKLQK